MKNFARNDLSFSLCGLNCALCTMKLDGHCPGCGGGAGNQSCTIARCSLENGSPQYCFECRHYPCEKYNGITKFDSFITYHNQLSDMEKVQSYGLSLYHCELEEKAGVLRYLLENYNDGRRKTFFCLAANLLEIADIKFAMEMVEREVSSVTTLKEKAWIAVKHLEELAKQKGITLKLNKKPSTPNASK